MKYFLTLLLFFVFVAVHAQSLTVIDQDYKKAQQAAKAENKLIYVDFYTDWCGPCKKLDKLVFQNDSIKEILAKDIVLLKYNAENDSIFHLSKKHHVFSYPMAVLLNKEGYLIERMYAYEGESFESMSGSVTAFVDQSVKLDKEKKYLAGYSAQIDPSVYPDFYANFMERTDTKVDSAEVNDYLSSTTEVLSEQYFSTLLCFYDELNDQNAERVLQRKDEYVTLYGDGDVSTLIYLIASGKFVRAISENNSAKYDQAVDFANQALSPESVEEIVASFEIEYLKGQNKWDEVLELYMKMKEAGEMDNGYINYFSYGVYENCDDQNVIKTCLEWMKNVVEDEPSFDYLDTYAFLLYKAGNKQLAKEITSQAIAVGRQEDRKTGGLEKLLEKL